MTTTTWRRATAIVAALVIAATAGACEPPVPPVELAVTSTGSGVDADPGDGTCEVTPGAGDCTLPAAVDEGNALGAATITLPAGTYDTPNLEITGDLAIRGDVEDVQLANQEVRIAPGGHLDLHGVHSTYITGLHLIVEGTLVVTDSSLVVIESIWPAIDVRPGGTAVVANTIVAQALMPSRPAIRNEGTLVLRYAAVHAIDFDPDPPVLVNEGSVTSVGSIVTRCTGAAPVSLGANASADGSCAWSGPGDLSGAAMDFLIQVTTPIHYTLSPTSDLVDAIPVGVAGCGDGVGDMFGRPRPVDGDGDGVPACDIGAVERPAG